MSNPLRGLDIENAIRDRRIAAALRESEERYRRLVEFSPEPIIVHREEEIVYANPAAVELAGASTAEEVVGKSISRFLRSENLALAEVVLDSASHTSPFEPLEETFVTLDGRSLDVEVTPILTRHAGTPVVQVMVRDVTERRRAARILEERARLAQLGAEIGAALTEIDALPELLQRSAEIVVTHVEAAVARFWTLREGDRVLEPRAVAGASGSAGEAGGHIAVGDPGVGLIAHERKPYLTSSVVGDPRVEPQKWVRQAGIVAFAGYPLLVEPRLLGVMAIFSREPLSEMTTEALGSIARSIALAIENRRAAAALREALQKVEESDRLKNAFLANMSHEIRTPLNVILGYMDLLRLELPDEEARAKAEYFTGMHAASQRLIDTMHGVLDLSKLESGSFEYRPEPIDLVPLIEAAVAPFAEQASKRDLMLTVGIADHQATILFDEYCLSRTLHSVLDNALKFTARGGISVRLCREPAGELVLVVSDTGVGIDPKYLRRLFKPFSQEEFGYTRRYEGSGLGLAIAKRFLELGKASIEVDSAKGKGTTVTIRFDRSCELPFGAATAEPPPATPIAVGKGPARPATGKRRPPFRKPKLLIVEDDSLTRSIVQMIFDDEYAVLTADSGKEARRLLAQHKGEIQDCLMDLSLRGSEDGLSLTRFIRSDPDLRHIRVIATTAHAFPQDRERCLEAGCDAYLAKPFRMEELQALLRTRAKPRADKSEARRTSHLG